MSTAPQHPKLRQTIHRCLGRMLARCLDRAPAADDLPKVVGVYLDDLVEAGLTDADASRVEASIEKVGRLAERWPRPRDIMVHLPPRAPLKALDVEPVDRETALANVRSIKARLESVIVSRGTDGDAA